MGSRHLPAGDPRHPRRNIVIGTGLLVIGNPVVSDSLVPALPSLAQSYGVTASEAQLMLSASVLGIAIGQLFMGALSDAVGRKPVYTTGLLLFIALSLAAAVAPMFEVLVLLRFVQGAAISSCIVLARAILSDLYTGRRATGAFNILTGLQGAGAITMPVFGAAMLLLGGWQMNFLGMALLAAFTLVFVWFKLPESLPAEHRPSLRLGPMFRGFARLFRNARYWGYGIVVIAAHTSGLLLLGSSSFITQNVLGLTPLGNSVVMAIGMLGMSGTSFLYAWFGARFDPKKTLWAAQLVGLVVHAAFLCCVMLGWLTLPVFLAWMLIFMCTMAISLANGISLAMTQVDRGYGTATALLGAFQYGVGALLMPLGGIMGEASALPTALGAIVLSLIAVAARFGIERSGEDPT